MTETFLPKTVFSRVARVCKSDTGGTFSSTSWTSFVKARLNCSVPGDLPFHFDHIRDVALLDGGDTVYAVLTTADNALAGSAVCAFDLADIRANFEAGAFRAQGGPGRNWLPVKPPAPRPGTCGRPPTEAGLNFLRRVNLMDRAVDSRTGPTFVQASFRERLVSLGVKSFAGGVNLLVLGTTEGRVLKVIEQDGKSSLIEAVRVSRPGTPLRSVDLIGERIVATTEEELISVPLDRCSDLGSCEECLRVREDPFCKWNYIEDKCIRGFGTAYRADLFQELDECPVIVEEPTTTTTGKEDFSFARKVS